MSTNQLRDVETTSQAAAIIRAALPKEQKEERVFVLPLDANGKVLAKPILVAVGHEDGTAAIDPGTIFREALKAGAEEIIVAHSHPSGDPTPSQADIAATRELKDLASRLGVAFLDHLVIGSGEDDGFVSLAERGD
ncbi:MAG: JAB domain-containing protein [Kiritimatiellia bacterium]